MAAIVRHRKSARNVEHEPDIPLVEAGLDFIDDGVAIFDNSLRLKYRNRRFVDLGAYPPELMAPGTPIADLVRFDAHRGPMVRAMPRT